MALLINILLRLRMSAYAYAHALVKTRLNKNCHPSNAMSQQVLWLLQIKTCHCSHTY